MNPKLARLGEVCERRPAVALVVVCGFALAIRLVVLASFEHSVYGDELMPDEQVYAEWAGALHSGEHPPAFIDDFPALPAHVFTFAYAVLGPEASSVRLLNVVLGTLACLCLYLIGAALADRRVGLLAALLGAIYGPLLLHSVTAHKTALGVLLVGVAAAAGARAVERPRPVLLAVLGAALALCVHARPNAVVLLAVAPLSLLYYWGRSRLLGPDGEPARPPIAPLLGAYAVALLVLLVPLSRGGLLGAGEHGFNLYLAGDLENPTPYFRPVRFAPAQPAFQARGFVLAASLETGRTLSREQARGYYSGKLEEAWRAQPGKAVAKLLTKLGAAIHAYEPANNHSPAYVAGRVPALAFPWLGFSLLLPLALLGFFERFERPPVRWLGIVALAYGLTLVIFFNDTRLRAPLALLLLPLSAAGVMALLVHRGRALSWRLGALALGFAFTHLPVPGAGDESAAHNMHALFLFEDGELDASERLYRTSLELGGLESDSALLGLAAIATRRGDLDAAEAHVSRIDDAHFRAAEKYQHLGAIRLRQGRPEQAAEMFERALEINPGTLRIYPLASELWQRLGRADRANAVRERERYAQSFFE